MSFKRKQTGESSSSCENAEKQKICLYLQSQNNGFGSGERGKSSSRDRKGEVPEWSIGPHSKCGVRATVPGVRIPPSPLNVLDRNGQQTDKKLQINDLWLFLLPESPASKTSKVR